MPTKAELAADARALVRRALKASLATIAAGSGYPYASLITVATEASGAPVFLISTLAQHTKNLSLDPRASILFDGTGAAGDPLQGARVTLYRQSREDRRGGGETAVSRAASRGRILCRLPRLRLLAARGRRRPLYRRLRPHRRSIACRASCSNGRRGRAARGRAGHHRAYERGPRRCRPPLCHAARRCAGRLLAHERHRPEGCDLIFEGDARRIRFRAPISTPGEARAELVRLANEAREPD